MVMLEDPVPDVRIQLKCPDPSRIQNTDPNQVQLVEYSDSVMLTIVVM
jgi:hypothetical protein